MKTAEGNRRPGDFEKLGAFDLFGFNARALAIPDGEKNQRSEDQHRHDGGDNQEKDVQRIHAAGGGGGASGQNGK